MADKLSLFDKRMINLNGDLRERVIYQRHMADDIFTKASGVIEEALLAVASGILAEDFVLAGAAKNIPNPHYIYSLNTNVIPDVSGTRYVGTAPVSWGYGYFDNLEAANTMYAETYYGDGSNLTGVTSTFLELTDTPSAYAGFTASGVRVNGAGTALEFCDLSGTGGGGFNDHNLLNNLAWSVAGHTINTDLIPTASGTIDIGSVSLSYDNAWIDRIFLEADPTDDLGAVTKQYVDTAIAGVTESDTLQSVTDRGATTSNIITPNASGTIDLGTVSLAFNDAYVDKVNLGANPTTYFQAANKGYVDEQIGGITESDTLEIVTGRGATTSNVITPNASGTVDLGTVSLAFNDGFFDRINLEADPTTPLQAATKQYVDTEVGSIIESDTLEIVTGRGSSTSNVIVPSASGTVDIGTVSLAFNDIYVDRVNLEADPTTQFQAANKGYVDAQIAAITETDTLQAVTDRGAITSQSITTAGLSVTGGSISPSASGTIDIGTIALAFDDAYIDKVFLEADPTTPLQAATKQYVDTEVASITESDTLEIVTGRGATTATLIQTGGLNVTGNIAPTASGTRDIGSISMAFDDAYIDKIYLESDPTTPLMAATKQYVDDQDASADAHITSDGTSHANVVLNDAHRADNTQAHSDYLINTGDTIAGVLTPEASGTRDLGSISLAFDNAYLDKVYLEADPTTPLQAATKQYVDDNAGGTSDHSVLSNLNWSTANHIIDADIIPNASGTIDLGSAALTYGDVYGYSIYAMTVAAGGMGSSKWEIYSHGNSYVTNTLGIGTNVGVTDDSPAIWMATNYSPAVAGGMTSLYRSVNNEFVIADTTVAYRFSSNSITTDSSGTIDIGSLANAFDEAYIDKVYLENAAPTDPLQAATKQYVDNVVSGCDTFLELTDTPASYANMAASGVRVNTGTDGLEFYAITDAGQDDHALLTNLEWSAAGHTVDSDIVPTASGTIDLGNISLAYGELYADNILTRRISSGGSGGGGWEMYSHGNSYVTHTLGIGTNPGVTDDAPAIWLAENDSPAASSATTSLYRQNGAFHIVDTTVGYSFGTTAFTPNASGTVDIGTVSLAFDDAHIDKVYLESNPTTPLQAATKQYVDTATTLAINTQTDNYTLVLGDANKLIEMNKGSAVTLTVPKNSSVAYNIGTTVGVIQKGAGTVTISPVDGDVTILSYSSLTDTMGQYAGATLTKSNTNTWYLTGALV